jgi:VanZ family protein
MKNIIKNWLPVLLWAAIIFFFSANPDPYRFLPASWRSAVPLPTLTNSSAAELLGQLMHLLEYGVLAFLVYRALHRKNPLPKIVLVVLILSMSYALSDEIHQLFVPGRTFQVIDLFIDLLGSLLGVYLYQRLKIEPQRRKERRKGF